MNRRFFTGLVVTLFLIGFFSFSNGCSKDPLDSDTGSFKDSRDQTIYLWAKIGTQIWMTRNLTYLPIVHPSADGSDTASLSYVYGYESTFVKTAKESVNYQNYGVLYNWPFANRACPEGWHLPSDAEWDVLANFLGGDSIAGVKLKSKNGWNDKGNGDNTSGFIALPGGYRNEENGFFLLGENAGFWTATVSDTADLSWVRDLGCNYPVLGKGLYSKKGGFSVRCLRN